MKDYDERDIWMRDPRPIIGAQLGEGQGAEHFDRRTGCRFERLERSGQMAPVPYLRVTTPYRDGISTGYIRTIEAPLERFGYVEYDERGA